MALLAPGPCDDETENARFEGALLVADFFAAFDAIKRGLFEER